MNCKTETCVYMIEYSKENVNKHFSNKINWIAIPQNDLDKINLKMNFIPFPHFLLLKALHHGEDSLHQLGKVEKVHCLL